MLDCFVRSKINHTYHIRVCVCVCLCCVACEQFSCLVVILLDEKRNKHEKRRNNYIVCFSCQNNGLETL